MKHILKNTLLLIMLSATILFHSCKKSSSPATIIGTWAITDIHGQTSTQSSPAAETITTAYSWSGTVLTEADTTSVTNITVNAEVWTFNQNGTYSLNENYKPSWANAAITHTANGWWDYTSSTTTNSTIVLRGGGTPTIVTFGGSFFIQSITSTQLVLTISGNSSSSTGATNSTNYVITLAKQ